MKRFGSLTAVALIAMATSACNPSTLRNASFAPEPVIGPLTGTAASLAELPAPPQPVTVAVYDFPDLTGQKKLGTTVLDLSTAVTQGASSLVIESLNAAGGGSWFNVVDRTRDADQNREQALLKAEKPRATMRPIKGADYIINGGVIAFERSVLTNSAGAAYLGIGGNANRNRNFVSVTMRMVNAQTSEVVQSVTVHKSIDSIAGGAFSRNRSVSGLYPDRLLALYPSVSDFLEADFSGSVAEMTEVALREAIEAAIGDLIRQGNEKGLWKKTKRSSRPVSALSLGGPLQLRLNTAPKNTSISTDPDSKNPAITEGTTSVAK